MNANRQSRLEEYMRRHWIPDEEALAHLVHQSRAEAIARDAGVSLAELEGICKRILPNGPDCVVCPETYAFGFSLADLERSESPAVTATRQPATNLNPDTNADLPTDFLVDHPPITADTDQGKIGSCVSWAGAHVMEGLINQLEGTKDWRANPSFLYGIIKGRRLDAWPQQHGSTLSALATAIERHGCVEWDAMPIYREAPPDNPANLPLPVGIESHGRNNRANGTFWIDEWNVETRRLAMALMAGHFGTEPRRTLAICAAFIVTEAFFNAYTARTGIVLLPPAGDKVLGGHAVTIVGWKTIGRRLYFIVKNSWGSRFGDHGYLYFPADYLDRFFTPSFFVHTLVRERPKMSGLVRRRQNLAKPVLATAGLASVLGAAFLLAPILSTTESHDGVVSTASMMQGATGEQPTQNADPDRDLNADPLQAFQNESPMSIYKRIVEIVETRQEPERTR